MRQAMDLAFGSSVSPGGGAEENPNKKPRTLNGLLVFDLESTADWEALPMPLQQIIATAADAVAPIRELSAHSLDEDTGVPGVSWRHVFPASPVYGERSGLQLDPNKVAEGRLRELRQMNDHHVYDWTAEADIPRGQKIETALLAGRLEAKCRGPRFDSQQGHRAAVQPDCA